MSPHSVGSLGCLNNTDCGVSPHSVGSLSCLNNTDCGVSPHSVGSLSCLNNTDCGVSPHSVGSLSCLNNTDCGVSPHSVGSLSCLNNTEWCVTTQCWITQLSEQHWVVCHHTVLDHLALYNTVVGDQTKNVGSLSCVNNTDCCVWTTLLCVTTETIREMLDHLAVCLLEFQLCQICSCIAFWSRFLDTYFVSNNFFSA